jgi:tetratricopeptide (TPR) repeat protein
MSVNNAEPTGEVKNYPDEPLPSDNGVNYDSYASDDNVKKATNTGLDFDSKEFERRQKHEYFVNVAGAEKLKREEERREAIAEKQRLKELKKISAVSHDEKKTVTRTDSGDDAQKKIQRKIANEKRRTRFVSIFGNKKLLLITGVVVVAAVGAVAIWLSVVAPRIDVANYNNDMNSVADSNGNAQSIEYAAHQKAKEGDYDGAKALFVDALMNSEGERKIYVAIYYASFLYEYEGNIEKAVAVLDEVLSIKRSKLAEDDLYNAYVYLYEQEGDIEELKRTAERFGREYDIQE